MMDENRSEKDIRRLNRNAAWRWGSLVVGLLTLQVIGGVTSIILATSDESVAVIPDYHQKALRWDEEMSVRAASAKLGWSTDLATHGRGMNLSVFDQDGNRVAIASGKIEWYHLAKAAKVNRFDVNSVPTGSIDLQRCFDADGRWNVTLDLLDEQGNRFVHAQEIYVTIDSSAEAT